MHSQQLIKTDNSNANLTNKINDIGREPIKPQEENELIKAIISNLTADSLAIIYVHGGFYNRHGHSILKLGDQGYLHVNTLYGRPTYISSDANFNEQGGEILGVQELHLKYPQAAKNMLQKLVSERWFWQVSHHNCLTFIHKVAIAGGVSLAELGYLSNDPKLVHGTAKYPNRFFRQQRNYHNPVNLAINVRPEKNRYIAEMQTTYKNIFVNVDSQNKLNEISEYYATLRVNGISYFETLDYVAIGCNVSLCEAYNKTIANDHNSLSYQTLDLRLSQGINDVCDAIESSIKSLCGVRKKA